jgi:hypothetical protein
MDRGATVRIEPCTTAEVVATAHGRMDMRFRVEERDQEQEIGEEKDHFEERKGREEIKKRGCVAVAETATAKVSAPLSEFVEVIWPLNGYVATEDLCGWAKV